MLLNLEKSAAINIFHHFFYLKHSPSTRKIFFFFFFALGGLHRHNFLSFSISNIV